MNVEDPLEKLAHMRLGNGRPPGVSDPQFAAEYPRLFTGLISTRTPNGDVKEAGTITIRQALATVEAVMRVETWRGRLTVICASLEAVSSALKEELKKPLPNWKPIRGKEPAELRKPKYQR